MSPAFPGEPICVIAGGGELPRLVAEQAAARGFSPRILAIGDGMSVDWSPFESSTMPWGRLGDSFGFLKSQGVRRVVLCGTVSVRPDFRSIMPSLKTLAMLPLIFSVIRGGDDNLLRKAARAFEMRGLELMAVQEIAPEILMPAGTLTSIRPQTGDEAAIELGFRAADALGALDIGQAVVASRERVIALEGIEGTREMLARVADLRARRRISPRERCVLVKGVKPGQDLRFDLPSIGLATIEEAASAGLSGIVLSAGHGLVIRIDDVLSAAARHDLFLLGRPVVPPSGQPLSRSLPS